MLEVGDIDVFYGASQALKKVSLSADKGRVTCVMGRNGVGKTTLMRAIAGQQAVSSGRVFWEGGIFVGWLVTSGRSWALPMCHRAGMCLPS